MGVLYYAQFLRENFRNVGYVPLAAGWLRLLALDTVDRRFETGGFHTG